MNTHAHAISKDSKSIIFSHFERCGNAQLFEHYYELKICLNDDNLAPARATCFATIFVVLGSLQCLSNKLDGYIAFCNPAERTKIVARRVALACCKTKGNREEWKKTATGA